MASQGFLRRTLGPDVIIPLIVVAAVAFLLLPLPGVLLDGALVISFGAAAFHLATVADAPTARTLAGFGSLTTGLVLLRTALAFAVTRRILAGEPPEGLVFALGASLSPFGPAAGLAVLAALALVHLTVVARGVERAAQVAARFALDALPGRQLALESAGRMGEADPDTLRRRRAALGAAAERAGTMDAAARFLRGEATALLALVVLDAVAGVAVPVLSRDVPFTEAWRAPLGAAAGAGLATLLPALLSGVAVGLFTARPGPSATADPVSGPSGSTREGPAPGVGGRGHVCAARGSSGGSHRPGRVRCARVRRPRNGPSVSRRRGRRWAAAGVRHPLHRPGASPRRPHRAWSGGPRRGGFPRGAGPDAPTRARTDADRPARGARTAARRVSRRGRGNPGRPRPAEGRRRTLVGGPPRPPIRSIAIRRSACPRPGSRAVR
jgi:hypothetical protein